MSAHIAGLYIAEYCGNANHSEIILAIKKMGAPELLDRFIGVRLSHGTLGVRVSSTAGAVLSGRLRPTEGVLQGGVRAPSLWVLHTKNAADQAKSLTYRTFPNGREG